MLPAIEETPHPNLLPREKEPEGASRPIAPQERLLPFFAFTECALAKRLPPLPGERTEVRVLKPTT